MSNMAGGHDLVLEVGGLTKTFEEALQNIQDAIADYLAVVDELLGDAEVREVDVAL